LQGYAGELLTGIQQAVLDFDGRSRRVGVSESLMVEISTTNQRIRVVAYREPHLRLRRLSHVVSRPCSTHLRGDPMSTKTNLLFFTPPPEPDFPNTRMDFLIK
jgi:hypothetical protein